MFNTLTSMTRLDEAAKQYSDNLIIQQAFIAGVWYAYERILSEIEVKSDPNEFTILKNG